MSEVMTASRMWRGKMYVLSVVMVLSGPGFLGLSVLLHANVWAGILIAAVLSMILVPLGLTLGRDARRSVTQRRLAERSRAGS